MSTSLSPNRVNIQIELWGDVQFLKHLQVDLVEGRKAPSKRWTNVMYLIQTKASLCDKLLDSIKDSEIEQVKCDIAEIKEALSKRQQ